jgi:DNA-binding response OmpR family regulator
MNSKAIIGEVSMASGRLWRFADYELDEMARELRFKGRSVELESKPLDILLQLLLHAGEVVTKEELLESRLARCDGGGWIFGDRCFKAAQGNGGR